MNTQQAQKKKNVKNNKIISCRHWVHSAWKCACLRLQATKKGPITKDSGAAVRVKVNNEFPLLALTGIGTGTGSSYPYCKHRQMEAHTEGVLLPASKSIN